MPKEEERMDTKVYGNALDTKCVSLVSVASLDYLCPKTV